MTRNVASHLSSELERGAGSIQSVFGQPGSTPATGADLDQVMDQVFDFVEQMLEVQREFAKNLAVTAVAAVQQASQEAASASEVSGG